MPDQFLDYWGQDAAPARFHHYSSLGIRDNTVFLGFPTAPHRDNNYYGGGGQSSWLFANSHTPIWDEGANGPTVNENNNFALYVNKTVARYHTYTKFWEILNEPDLDLGGNTWKYAGQPGNRWENNPLCALYNMKARKFHYMHLFRISYEK